MLKGYSVLFKHCKHFPAKAPLGVHHILFQSYNRKILASRYARYQALSYIPAFIRDYHSPRVFRMVGILNINGNAAMAHGKNGVLMQNGRAHIR